MNAPPFPLRIPTRLYLRAVLLLVLSTSSLSPVFGAKGLGWHADALALELDGVKQLPALPDGVAELKFSDFYQMPVGPGGLVFTEKLKSLSGRRVRIMGFMVRQTRPSSGVAILSPFALTTHENEYDVCDDLPPATLFVEVAKYQDIAVPFTPGPLLFTGRLETGRRVEADGRTSFIRLVLDPESPAGNPAAATSNTAKNTPSS